MSLFSSQTTSQSLRMPEQNEHSSEGSDDNGPDSNSTQPPISECRMRNPPKYLSARQVWLNKDLSEDNPYRKFFKNANNPKWHPPWRPPSPPSGWALYQAQVDTVRNMLITDADLCPSENVYDNFYFKDGIFHFFCSLFFKVIQHIIRLK